MYDTTKVQREKVCSILHSEPKCALFSNQTVLHLPFQVCPCRQKTLVNNIAIATHTPVYSLQITHMKKTFVKTGMLAFMSSVRNVWILQDVKR